MTDHDLDAAMERVAEVAATHAAEVDRTARFPTEAVDALRHTGLLGLTVPERLGGWGHGPVSVTRVISGVARHCASTGMILTMHIAAVGVLATANRDPILREAAAGRHLATLALSERATRSNFWIAMSTLTEHGNGTLQVAAEKSFVTSAGPADSYIVSVATPGRDHLLASDLLLIQAEDGVEVLDWWRGSGLRGNASAPMRFQCTVSTDARLAPSGQGLQWFIDTIIPWFQLGAAAVSVGLCFGALDVITSHLQETELAHLDQRLIEQPVIRHSLGRLAVDALAAEGMLATVASAMEQGDVSLEPILAVKAHANEAALAATDRAMRLGGGAAYAGNSPLDRLFRDARAGVIMAPTPDAIYDMIGRGRSGQSVL